MIEKKRQESNWAVRRRLHVCCSYSETSIITVLKSVFRILFKTPNPGVCVTVNCKVCRSAIALYYLSSGVECIKYTKCSHPIKPRLIVSTLIRDSTKGADKSLAV
jgi:hypothetical protein